MNRRAVFLIASAVSVLLILTVVVVLTRQRYRRRAVFHRPPAAKPVKAPPGIPPVEQWTDRFSQLEEADQWSDLSALLDEIAKKYPALYEQNALGYLHARASIETNDPDDAKAKLQPFLKNDYRELALFHIAEIDDSSAARQELIFKYPSSIHRDEAIEDETELLARGNDVNALAAFASKLPERHRDLDAHIAEMMIRLGQTDAGMAKALAVLHGGTSDDPADRAARALDHPDILRRLNAAQLATLGDAMQNHRHFDRAEAILALPQVPKTDDVIFAIGRSYYGDEKFADAQQWYLRGANTTRDPKQKVTFLWHAARSVQLMGDDAGAERLMTAAIAVPVQTPATLAALTQRMRTRLKQKRVADANADLALIRKSKNKETIREAEEAYELYTKLRILRDGETKPAKASVSLSLSPSPFPKFPLKTSDRASQLMAMGLFDEAIDDIPKRWPLHPANSALTQALALNRGGASRQSIYAAEVLAKEIGETRLPKIARELLYPRYFYDSIVEDSKAYGADPNLVLAIMREESRFNPRAKSEAAARGLLQFIITTARDIGREVGLVDIAPDDLYDPRIVIRLGTKYIATLSNQFHGNKYAVVAAYNAGPKQVALWQRLAPAPADEYFVASINFDETRDYVKKVMHSYREYETLYR
ncbi:MAG TPA: lytic transglycosylase domain-containing protein [Thermoanaerobaculia bacterium]|nr:lytic transglycosylase domain-containing protein [Thermoanaerobaculia bacterium]